MPRLLSAAMIVGTVLGTASLTYADAVLVSAPMNRGGVPFNCLIVNAGKKNVTGSIDLMGSSGSPITAPTFFDLDPGEFTNNGIIAAAGPSALYCRFTLTKGNKKAVRAQACAFSSVDTSGPCLSTAEAR